MVTVPETESKLVIEGSVTNQLHTQVVKISMASAFNSPSRTPKVSNATVSVIDNTGTIETYIETPEPGIYHSELPYEGLIGVAYKLQISVGGQSYESDFQVMKTVPPIDFLSFEEDNSSRLESFIVSVNVTDSDNEGDFYRWKVFKNGLELGTLADIFLRSDRLFNANKFDVRLDTFSFLQGDTCSVVQMSLTESAFEFFRLIQIQAGGLGESTSPPATQVIGNIRNINRQDEEILGFFYATGMVEESIVIQ